MDRWTNSGRESTTSRRRRRSKQESSTSDTRPPPQNAARDPRPRRFENAEKTPDDFRVIENREQGYQTLEAQTAQLSLGNRYENATASSFVENWVQSGVVYENEAAGWDRRGTSDTSQAFEPELYPPPPMYSSSETSETESEFDLEISSPSQSSTIPTLPTKTSDGASSPRIKSYILPIFWSSGALSSPKLVKRGDDPLFLRRLNFHIHKWAVGVRDEQWAEAIDNFDTIRDMIVEDYDGSLKSISRETVADILDIASLSLILLDADDIADQVIDRIMRRVDHEWPKTYVPYLALIVLRMRAKDANSALAVGKQLLKLLDKATPSRRWPKIIRDITFFLMADILRSMGKPVAANFYDEQIKSVKLKSYVLYRWVKVCLNRGWNSERKVTRDWASFLFTRIQEPRERRGFDRTTKKAHVHRSKDRGSNFVRSR